MEVVRERKKLVLRDIFQVKLKGGEQMRGMLLFSACLEDFFSSDSINDR